ncbi:MAG: hypothetical protein ABSE55_11740 [Terracidiphilus sp.]|jgi:hypothetical protein
MAVSRALRRLLRIRDLQEEQSRLVLESVQGELHRLENAMAATLARDRQGRSLVQAGARTGELPDRLAGLEETRVASLHAAALAPRIDATGEEVAGLRKDFLFRRVERRQAETLIQETEAREAVENGRRSQQALDDWYGSRPRGNGGGARADDEPVTLHATELVSHANDTSEETIDRDACVAGKS